eukprot:765203-Hanusia_phi.AAC.9
MAGRASTAVVPASRGPSDGPGDRAPGSVALHRRRGVLNDSPESKRLSQQRDSEELGTVRDSDRILNPNHCHPAAPQKTAALAASGGGGASRQDHDPQRHCCSNQHPIQKNGKHTDRTRNLVRQ